MDNYRNMFESRISAEAKEKLPCSGKPDADVSSWSYDMEGHAKKYVESYCELANKTNHQLSKVVTPCLAWSYDTDGHAKKCVEKCCELTKPKWTSACDKRVTRLISYIRHSCEYKHYCHVSTLSIGLNPRLRFC